MSCKSILKNGVACNMKLWLMKSKPIKIKIKMKFVLSILVILNFSTVYCQKSDQMEAISGIKKQEKEPDIKTIFAEINDLLAKGLYTDELIGKLEYVLMKEPNNIGVLETLGNVYIDLIEKVDYNSLLYRSYFTKSLQYYEKVKSLKPDYHEIKYSLGRLYYSKATHMLKFLNSVGSELSNEKYDEHKSDIVKCFDLALPFFESYESVYPFDRNTTMALLEIYKFKKNEIKSKEYQKKLSKL